EFGTPVYDNNGNVINFFDPVSGMSSNEICIQTNRDLPLMTHVDVNATDNANGEIYIQWSRPNAEELDTLQNPPPYRYELYSSDDLNGGNFGFSPIYVSPDYTDFYLAVDTFFTDLGLNTLDNPHSYRVAFYTNGDTLGFSSIAASIYLNVAASDETNNLTWQENVPWTNEQYVVHLETPTGSGTFTVLDTVTTRAYSHTGLVNGEEYCYYIEAIGTYNLAYIQDPLLNKSQIACGIPLDTIAPCPPDVSAIVGVSGCEGVADATPATDLFNTISWQNNEDSCANDVARFRVYFAPFCNGQYTLVGESAGLTDTFILHQPDVNNLAGCYYITSIDSVEVNGGGNESLPSGVVQTDNCPVYNLPNVFTPNGDDRNDLYVPFKPYRYIQQVEFKVHNRWGQLVYETTDPEISWDGRDMNTGQLLAEGVYYYTCMVYESRLNPQEAYPLCGYIHIIHNSR
ncbi:MAG: gliding motility-associated C-terminal domain-containing protein, partial [Saprospiraceae bacterium]|nr:gliding motility-associated C-terminal domain-containing protein [Saprospiraceae bacterium]